MEITKPQIKAISVFEIPQPV